MKKLLKRGLVVLLAVCMMFGIVACGSEGSSTEGGATSGGGNTAEVANDYYLDLTELGMKLTVFLRLNEDGTFIFSNTLDFAVDKSSGTFQKSGDEYIMVFTSVNGEEKSVSDGLTSSFVVTEDGNLDFSVGGAVPYGSANIDTVSEEDASIVLMGMVVTEDYQAPSDESAFQMGSYTAAMVEQDGIFYTHVITFYEDNSYLHFVSYDQNGQLMFMSETGTYGVSTTQLALEPDGMETEGMKRVECEVVDGTNIKASVVAYPGAERTVLDFAKADIISQLNTYSGTGTVTGTTDTFNASLTLYEDGSYETSAEGFMEKGVLAINSAENYVKQYPDHPETGVRGLTQVGTVPAGTLDGDSLVDIRVRTSDSLTRYACNME
ncbi:MAG: hypothetical protein IJ471_04745 [Eubacterium sp.]|nr:hypothetical protein [Eubacterium sp.]